MHFGVFQNLYQKVYVKVWTLLCPNLNVVLIIYLEPTVGKFAELLN
jgi:hypothetical protein